MPPDIALAQRAQQRIHQRVHRHIGVAVPVQPAIVRNLHAAQDQFSACLQPMRIVARSDPHFRRAKRRKIARRGQLYIAIRALGGG